MRFKEFYRLTVENKESVLEEGWMNKVNMLLTMVLLGVSYSSYKELETEYNNLKKKNPQKVQNAENLAKEIEQRKDEIIKNPEILNGVVANPEAITDIIKKDKNIKFDQPKNQLIAPNKEKSIETIKNNIKEYIRFHEIGNQGIRNSSYKDSKGYSTIGIGHLVLDSEVGRGKLFTPDEISYKTIKGVKRKIITISDKKAEQIFNKDFNSKIAIATSKFPSLFEYPEKLQTAIIDTFFRGDLSSYKRTPQVEARASIRNAMNLFFKYKDSLKKGQMAEAQNYIEKGKDYLEIAAAKYLEHPDNHDGVTDGVDIRMRKNANLIRSALNEYSVPNQIVNPEYTPNF
jgi:hypothetical protein